MQESEKNLQSLLEQIEARERKARKRSMFYTLVPIFFGVVLLFFTGKQISRFNEEAEVANKVREQVRRDIEEWTTQLIDALSLMQASNLDSAKHVLDKLTTALQESETVFGYVDVQLATSNFDLAKQVLDVMKSKPDSTKISSSTAKIKPRVYMHIRSKLQIERTMEIATKLKDEGYIVPREDILVDKGPKNTQVRYFRKAEEDEAKEIAKILVEKFTLHDTKLIYLSGYESSKAIRPRHYEIWFAEDSFL